MSHDNTNVQDSVPLFLDWGTVPLRKRGYFDLCVYGNCWYLCVYTLNSGLFGRTFGPMKAEIKAARISNINAISIDMK